MPGTIHNKDADRRSNILLVIPRYKTYGEDGRYVMPLGILYVSSYLKAAQVCNVHTINLNHREGEELDILRQEIDRHDIDIFAVGGLSGEYMDISRMVGYAREIKPSLIIIAGGGIVTADPVTTMRAIPQIDYGIIGEGELTSVELITALSRGEPVDGVEGIIYRKNGGLEITARRKEIVDLDRLPFPDYEGFDYGSYLRENPDISDDGVQYSQVSVIGGRSCKYNCTFCFHPSGSTYRQRSLDSVFAEIDYLVSHYDITYIALREELFATDNQRVEEFCRRVEAYDFVWSIQLRIDSINRELVELLKGTRCRYVFVGIESAHDNVLRSMRKGITLTQIEQALGMLKDAGLNTRSGVIFGDSAETWATANFSLDWFRANISRFRMFVDMIIAFPGSALYKRACRSGVIPDPVRFLVDGCPIVNLSQMPDAEFQRLVDSVEHINGRRYNVKFYK